MFRVCEGRSREWSEPFLKPIVLVCEHENVGIWALSKYISRYTTTIEGACNINTYNIGIYNINTLYKGSL